MQLWRTNQIWCVLALLLLGCLSVAQAQYRSSLKILPYDSDAFNEVVLLTDTPYQLQFNLRLSNPNSDPPAQSSSVSSFIYILHSVLPDDITFADAGCSQFLRDKECVLSQGGQETAKGACLIIPYSDEIRQLVHQGGVYTTTCEQVFLHSPRTIALQSVFITEWPNISRLTISTDAPPSPIQFHSFSVQYEANADTIEPKADIMLDITMDLPSFVEKSGSTSASVRPAHHLAQEHKPSRKLLDFSTYMYLFTLDLGIDPFRLKSCHVGLPLAETNPTTDDPWVYHLIPTYVINDPQTPSSNKLVSSTDLPLRTSLITFPLASEHLILAKPANRDDYYYAKFRCVLTSHHNPTIFDPQAFGFLNQVIEPINQGNNAVANTAGSPTTRVPASIFTSMQGSYLDDYSVVLFQAFDTPAPPPITAGQEEPDPDPPEDSDDDEVKPLPPPHIDPLQPVPTYPHGFLAHLEFTGLDSYLLTIQQFDQLRRIYQSFITKMVYLHYGLLPPTPNTPSESEGSTPLFTTLRRTLIPLTPPSGHSHPKQGSDGGEPPEDQDEDEVHYVETSCFIYKHTFVFSKKYPYAHGSKKGTYDSTVQLFCSVKLLDPNSSDNTGSTTNDALMQWLHEQLQQFEHMIISNIYFDLSRLHDNFAYTLEDLDDDGEEEGYIGTGIQLVSIEPFELPSLCLNSLQDATNTETDVDCGGDMCVVCSPSQTCQSNDDCLFLCLEGKCTHSAANIVNAHPITIIILAVLVLVLSL